MTPRKVALYLVGGSVLAAWLASAASVGQAPPTPAVPVPVQTSGTETLAQEVQAQAVRLRERLASAPAPQPRPRNPFAFAPAPRPPPRSVPAPAEPVPPPPVMTEPALSLIGMAEDRTPDGPLRTAIITAPGGELFMVRVGDHVSARYRVEAIGADAVELADLTTGAVRRLALR